MRLSQVKLTGFHLKIPIPEMIKLIEVPNRDYAIDIHELLSGEIKTARTYLTLAINRGALRHILQRFHSGEGNSLKLWRNITN